MNEIRLNRKEVAYDDGRCPEKLELLFKKL